MDYLAAAAVFCAYIVKGMAGFANTLVFSTIMSFSRANIAISPLELAVGYPANVMIAFKERKNLSLKIWLPLTILVISGSIPGVWLLKYTEVAVLKKLFGAVVFLIGAEMLTRTWGRKKRTESKEGVQGNAEERTGQKTEEKRSFRLVLGVTGFLSGLLCGMFGIGAFLAAYISRVTDDPGEFRGNLCMVFLFENTLRLFLYVKEGILTRSMLSEAVGLYGFMAAGLIAGMFLAGKMRDDLVKKGVMVTIMISGIALVL